MPDGTGIDLGRATLLALNSGRDRCRSASV